MKWMVPTRGVGRRSPTGCRNNDLVATASVTEKAPIPRPPTARPNLVSVGTIVWLSSELMFFAALFAIYFTIRSVDKGNGLPWPGAHLDLTLGSINTTVLLLSSVTCQLGVFAVQRVRLRFLHPHRGPRPARDRRAHRVPVRAGPHLRGQDLHPRAAGQRDRCLLLLALRGCRVDRPVHHDLPHPLRAAAPRYPAGQRSISLTTRAQTRRRGLH